jgi:probable blue pigment (indigoidine) exporter
VPFAVGFEGGFSHLTARSVAGFGYVTVVATGVAFVAWFAGLSHLDAGTVGLVGLLNPVAAVLLGTLVAGEPFGPRQITGMAIVLLGVLTGQRPGGWRRTRRVACPPVVDPVRGCP